MAAPAQDMWQCHLCGATYLKATTPACLNLSCNGHIKCNDCKDVAKHRSVFPEDGAIDSITKCVKQCALPGSAEDSLSTVEPDIREQDSIHISITMDDDSPEPPWHYNGTMPMHNLTQPSMAGWWKCCVCRNDNNPILTDGKCSSCNHVRDAFCTALG